MQPIDKLIKKLSLNNDSQFQAELLRPSTKHIFKIYNNSQSYIAKIYQQATKTQIQNEIRLYQEKSLASYFPRFILSEPSVLVFEYIQGRHLNKIDYEQSETIKRLMHFLIKLHQLPTEGYTRTTSSIQRCQEIQSRLLKQKINLPIELINLQQHCERLTISPKKLTVIHSDVHCKNIILTPSKQLKIIDWTDCGVGDPYEDLAEVAIFFNPLQLELVLAMYDPEYGEDSLKRLNSLYCQRIAWFAFWSYAEAVKRYRSDISLNMQQFNKKWYEFDEVNQKDFSVIISLVSRELMPLKSYEDYLLFAVVCYQHLKTILL